MNSFAAGVFLAIALCHILPEEAEYWTELNDAKWVDHPFSIPYVLLFFGYTLILLVYKLMFDMHASFSDQIALAERMNGPAEMKLGTKLKASIA